MRTLLLLGAVSLLCSHFCAALEDDAKKARYAVEQSRDRRNQTPAANDAACWLILHCCFSTPSLHHPNAENVRLD